MQITQKRNIGKVVWWNGKFMAPEEAKTSLFTHTLHYGLGAFEGIRCYKTADTRLAVFKLREHIERLFNSCKILEMKTPYSMNEVFNACLETIGKSGLDDGCYLRPIVFIGDGPLGVFPGFTPPIDIAILTWKWGAYLGEEAKAKGARVKIASFSRGSVNSMMSKAKANGQYITGILSKLEVKRMGYDEALLLDTDGYVAEGSGENIFMVRRGVLKTTPLTSILDGITRDTLITLAEKNGLKVIEQRFTRDELYCADEAFFCGTAAEITPIREVDDRMIGAGSPGPITKKLSQIYFDIVLGKSEKYKEWLTYL